MSNDWLNDLRRKMEDHTEDVPDGLWKNISEELFVEDETKKISGPVPNDLKAQKAVLVFNLPLLYRIGGVAATIVMFLILGGLFDFIGNKQKPELKKEYAGKDNFRKKTGARPIDEKLVNDIEIQVFSLKSHGHVNKISIKETFKNPLVSIKSGIEDNEKNTSENSQLHACSASEE